jgi:hypothetical protein
MEADMNAKLTPAAKKTLAALRATFGASTFLINFSGECAYNASGMVTVSRSVYAQLESRKLIAPVVGTLNWTVTAE